MDWTWPGEGEETRRQCLTTCAVLAVLACVAYLNTLGHEFVSDDQAQIVNRIGAGDFRSLHTIFTTDHFGGHRGGYRPLVTLSFALNYYVGGMAPLTYHLSNILLHAAVTVLVYRVIRRLFGRDFLAVGTAVLFALHPVHTEAVAWVSGRADLLTATLFLSAWVLYLRATQSTPLRHAPLLGSLLVFGLALLSKEHALMLPAVLLFSDLFPETTRQVGSRARSVFTILSTRRWVYLSYFAVIGLYLGLRYLLFGRALLYEPSQTLDLRNPLLSVPWYPRVLTAARILAADLGLFVWPAGLSADYSYNQIPASTSILEPDAGFAVGLMLLICLAAVILVWKGSIEGFGLMFYLIMIAATANVFTVTHTIRAERLLYLPSLGICLAVVAALERFARWLGVRRGRRWTPALAVGMGVVCLALAVRTVLRNQDWKDHHSLWRSTAQVATQSAVARYGFGLSLANRGEVDQAIEEYQQAILIYPAYREARMALGIALIRSGEDERGLGILHEVVSEKPGAPDGYRWLGEGLVMAGMLDEGVAAYQQALSLKPDHGITHYLLGTAFLKRGDVEKAISSYQQALALLPDSPSFLISLGYAYLKQGRYGEARAAADRALHLAPKSPRALVLLRTVEQSPTPSPGPEAGQQ